MAGKTKGITIEIGGNTTKLQTALKEVNGVLRQTQADLKDIDRLLRFDPGNTELLRQKQIALQTAIDGTEEKLRTEREALRQLKEADQTPEVVKQQNQLQLEIIENEQKLKSLQATYKEFGSVAKQQIMLVGDQLQQTGRDIDDFGKKVSGIGRDLTMKLTVPIVGGFLTASKAVVDYESAFTGVRKTVDATEEEFAVLDSTVREMSTRMASSKEAIAGTMEVAGQLGVTGVDGLTAFTETMIMLGDTTNLSSDAAATALARFQNITGSSYEDVGRLGSAIVDLGNNMATSESEIVGMATNLAAAGTLAGLTDREILALSAAMSSVGIEAEAGGTAMSQTLQKLEEEVTLYGEGLESNLETFARVAGMEADEFARAWETKPMEAITSFVAGLGSLDESGESATLILDELGMSGVRQSRMLKSLGLASDQLAGAVDIANSAYEENTALTEEAAKRYDTLAAKGIQMKEELSNFALRVGELITPIITRFTGKLREVLQWLETLSDEQLKFALTIAAVIAAIGPVLLVVGGVISAIGKIVSGVGALIKVIGMVATPVGAVVAAVLALIAVFTYFYTTNEGFREKVNAIWQGIKDVIAAVVEWIKGAVAAFTEFVGALWEKWGDKIKFIVEIIWGGIKMFIQGVLTVIKGIVDTWTAIFNGDWAAAWEGIKTIFSGVWEAIKGAVVVVCTAIGTYFAVWFELLKNAFTVAWNFIKSIFVTVWTAIIEVVTAALARIREWIATVMAAIKERITTIWNAIKTTISTVMNAIKTTISTVWTNIKTTISNAINNVKTTVSNGLNSVKEKASSILNTVKSTFTRTFDNIKSHVRGVVEWLKGIFDFKWSLPAIPLPHFSVNGSFSLNPPSVPSFSIDWYKKAYTDAIAFTTPTILPTASGLKGFGDGNGAEIVIGQNKLLSSIAQAAGTEAMVSRLDIMTSLLAQYLPEMANMDVVMDGDALVGQIAPAMNRQLGLAYR